MYRYLRSYLKKKVSWELFTKAFYFIISLSNSVNIFVRMSHVMIYNFSSSFMFRPPNNLYNDQFLIIMHV